MAFDFISSHVYRLVLEGLSGSESHYMYYVNDGVFGSFNYLMYNNGHAEVEHNLLEVRLQFILLVAADVDFWLIGHRRYTGKLKL